MNSKRDTTFRKDAGTAMKSSDAHNPESLLYRIRHSLAHVLAQAVLEIRPNAKLGFGPPVENGFYYDFDLSPPLTPEDFPDLEKRMRRIINHKVPFERQDPPVEQVFADLKKIDATYKLEQAEELKAKGEDLSIYKSGE